MVRKKRQNMPSSGAAEKYFAVSAKDSKILNTLKY
jgi:hypothetical protein